MMKGFVRSGVFTLATYFIAAGAASASTYYVSISTGSDANTATQAQSKNTPWAHLPMMANATANSLAHTPVPGDTFILKGCDVWTNASLPVILPTNVNGVSGNPIVIDRDTTWFNTTNCPTTWNRAVWDAQGAVINPPECGAGKLNGFFSAPNNSYWTFRWIEARGLFYTNGACNTRVLGMNGDFLIFENWYIHKWTASGLNATTSDTDGMVASIGTAPPACQHCNLDHFVIDNTDGLCNGAPPNYLIGKACGGGVQMSIGNSVLHEMVNAIKPYTEGTYHDNNIYHIGLDVDGVTHPNCFESVGALNTKTFYIYNNYIHDIGGCEGLQIGNNGEIDYVWNNIFDFSNGGAGANGPQVPQSETPVSMFFWNNTVVWTAGCLVSAGHGFTWSGTFAFQNNHCINDGLTTLGGTPIAATVTNDHNIGRSIASAASQGYTGTTPYVYSPQNGNCNGITTNCPVGAGINLTPNWMIGFPPGDTTYACAQQTVAGVVQSVCPQRNPVARPPSAAWDVGAYFHPTGPQPQPPFGLAAIVQ